MFETSVFSYYAFGYNYYILRHRTEGARVKGTDDSLAWYLDQVLGLLNTLNLPVTSQAAVDLKQIRERLDSMEDEVVDASLAQEVEQACDIIDVTLDAELQLRSAFVVLPGRYSADHLLKEPWALLGSETMTWLPDIALFDFVEACRAIAFGMATAAVFHLMRGVEGMLREYYRAVVKQKRIKQQNWGPIVQHLRGKNATSHPKRYSIIWIRFVSIFATRRSILMPGMRRRKQKNCCFWRSTFWIVWRGTSPSENAVRRRCSTAKVVYASVSPASAAWSLPSASSMPSAAFRPMDGIQWL